MSADLPSSSMTPAPRGVLLYVAWTALVLGCLKGIRVPGRWVATHYQFDYALGFVKRSLFGEVLKGLGVPVQHYWMVVVVATLMTAASCAAVIWFLQRARVTASTRGAGVVAMMASSFAVPLMFHLTGYFDHLHLVLCVPVTWAILSAGRAPLARAASMGACIVATVIGVLVHEVYLVVVCPLICLALMLRKRWGEAVVFGAVAIGATAWLMEAGVGDRALSAQMLRHHRALVDFPLRTDAFNIFARAVSANHDVTAARFEQAGWIRGFVGSLAVLLPTALFFLYIGARRLWAAWRDDALWERAVGVFTFAVVALGPLALHLFGWDMHRWNALCVVTAFLGLAAIWRVTPHRVWGARETAVAWRVGVVVVIVNLMASYGFFDGYHPEPAPFFKHIEFLEHLTDGGTTLFEVPRY